MDMMGLDLLEKAAASGGSHILFLGRKSAASPFLPHRLQELDPGAHSGTWEAAQIKDSALSHPLEKLLCTQQWWGAL